MADQPNCSEAIQAQTYLENGPFRSVLFVYIATNLICVATNVIFLVKSFHKIFLPPHIKILMKGQIFSNMVHGFFMLTLSMCHLYLFSTSQNGCQILVTRFFCIFFKIPVDTSIACLIILTASVVLERIFATYRLKTFEKSTTKYGRIFCILSVIKSLFWGSYLNTRTPLNTVVPFCASNSEQTQSASLLMGTMLLFIEVTSIISFFIIRFINRRWNKKLKFDVTLRYQLDENLNVLNIIWPWMFTHFVFIIFFYIGLMLPPRIMDWKKNEIGLRTLIGYTYLLPIGFSTISPLIMWIVFDLSQRKRKQRLVTLETRATGDQYYNAYRSMW